MVLWLNLLIHHDLVLVYSAFHFHSFQGSEIFSGNHPKPRLETDPVFETAGWSKRMELESTPREQGTFPAYPSELPWCLMLARWKAHAPHVPPRREQHLRMGVRAANDETGPGLADQSQCKSSLLVASGQKSGTVKGGVARIWVCSSGPCSKNGNPGSKQNAG